MKPGFAYKCTLPARSPSISYFAQSKASTPTVLAFTGSCVFCQAIMNYPGGAFFLNKEQQGEKRIEVRQEEYLYGNDDNDDELSSSSSPVIMDPFEAAADEYYNNDGEPLTFPASYEIVLEERPRNKVTFIIEDQSFFKEDSSSLPKDTQRRVHSSSYPQQALHEAQGQDYYHQEEHRDDDIDSLGTLSTKDSETQPDAHRQVNSEVPCFRQGSQDKEKEGIDSSLHTAATSPTIFSSSSSTSSPQHYPVLDDSASVTELTTALCLSASIYEVLDSRDDSFFTEGFVCVGDLPRVY